MFRFFYLGCYSEFSLLHMFHLLRCHSLRNLKQAVGIWDTGAFLSSLGESCQSLLSFCSAPRMWLVNRGFYSHGFNRDQLIQVARKVQFSSLELLTAAWLPSCINIGCFSTGLILLKKSTLKTFVCNQFLPHLRSRYMLSLWNSFLITCWVFCCHSAFIM